MIFLAQAGGIQSEEPLFPLLRGAGSLCHAAGRGQRGGWVALGGAWAPPTPKMLPGAEPRHGRGQGTVTMQALSPWGTTFFGTGATLGFSSPEGCPALPCWVSPRVSAVGGGILLNHGGGRRIPPCWVTPNHQDGAGGGPCTPPCPNPAPACHQLSWRGTLGECHREHRGHLRLLSPGQLPGVHFSVPITCWPPARPQHGTEAFPPGAPCARTLPQFPHLHSGGFLSEEGREASADAGGVPVHPPHPDTPKL